MRCDPCTRRWVVDCSLLVRFPSAAVREIQNNDQTEQQWCPLSARKILFLSSSLLRRMKNEETNGGRSSFWLIWLTFYGRQRRESELITREWKTMGAKAQSLGKQTTVCHRFKEYFLSPLLYPSSPKMPQAYGSFLGANNRAMLEGPKPSYDTTATSDCSGRCEKFPKFKS